jgi:hypothetical protein
MHPVLISAAIFIIFSFPARQPASAGSDSPPVVFEQDEASLVKTAFDATNWDDAQATPFQLTARVKLFEEHGKTTDGQLRLVLAAQDRWREEINWYGVTTVAVVVGDRFWKKGPEQQMLSLLHVNESLGLYGLLSIGQGSISSSHSKDLQGTPARCVNVTFNAYAQREICLDANTGLPLRIKDEIREVTVLQGDYLPLGLKRFPHHVRYSRHGETILELNIDSVTVLENPPADAFTPLEQADSLPWCPDERPSRMVPGGRFMPYWMPASNRSYSVLMVGASPTSEFSLVVFDVGGDGKVKGVKLYDKHWAIVQSDYAAQKLGDVTFYPATCADKGVESEFLFPSPHH